MSLFTLRKVGLGFRPGEIGFPETLRYLNRRRQQKLAVLSVEAAPDLAAKPILSAEGRVTRSV